MIKKKTFDILILVYHKDLNTGRTIDIKVPLKQRICQIAAFKNKKA